MHEWIIEVKKNPNIFGFVKCSHLRIGITKIETLQVCHWIIMVGLIQLHSIAGVACKLYCSFNCFRRSVAFVLLTLLFFLFFLGTFSIGFLSIGTCYWHKYVIQASSRLFMQVSVIPWIGMTKEEHTHIFA